MRRHAPEPTVPDSTEPSLDELAERLASLMQMAEILNPDRDLVVRNIDRERLPKEKDQRQRWCLEKIAVLERHNAELQHRRQRHMAEVAANRMRYPAIYAQIDALTDSAVSEARNQPAVDLSKAQAAYDAAKQELQAAPSGAGRVVAEDAAFALATALQVRDMAERTYQEARHEAWRQLLAESRAARAAARQQYESAIAAYERALELEDQGYETFERDIQAARQLEAD